jgi:2-amino-4-hydroxy-6-hydroxymethyldihydropteridine diphosphokinase
MHKEHVYIGLGSNLENPTKLVTEAFEAIAGIEDTRVLKTSSLYASKPMGPQDQPDYINAVCLIETALKPHSLLKQ